MHNNPLHTEPRAARVLQIQIVRRGPVNGAVMRWSPDDLAAMTTLSLRVSPLGLFALLFLVAGCKQSAPAQPAPSAENGGVSSFATKRHSLREFTVASGELVVSDPAYDAPKSVTDNGINGLIPKVKNGSWNAFVTKVDAGDSGNRCSQLMAHHVDHSPAASDKWATANFDVGVDSSQAGVFDRQTFGVDSTLPQGLFDKEEPLVPDQLWYSMCCTHTLTTLGAGVVPGGAVSCSGYWPPPG